MQKYYCLFGICLFSPFFGMAQSVKYNDLFNYSTSFSTQYFFLQQDNIRQSTMLNSIRISSNVLNFLPLEIGLSYSLETEPNYYGRFNAISLGLDLANARGNLNKARTKYQKKVSSTIQQFSNKTIDNSIEKYTTTLNADSIVSTITYDIPFNAQDSLKSIEEFKESKKNIELDSIKLTVPEFKKDTLVTFIKQATNKNLSERDSIASLVHEKKWFEKGLLSNLTFLQIGTFVPRTSSLFLSDLRMTGVSFETVILKNGFVQCGVGNRHSFVEYQGSHIQNTNVLELDPKFDSQYIIAGFKSLKNKVNFSLNVLKSIANYSLKESEVTVDKNTLTFSGITQINFDRERQKIDFEIGKSNTKQDDSSSISQSILFALKYQYLLKTGVQFSFGIREIGEQFNAQNSPFLQAGKREVNAMIQISKQKYFLIPMISLSSPSTVDLLQSNQESNQMYFLQGGWIPSATFKILSDLSYFSSKYQYSINKFTAIGIGAEYTKRFPVLTLISKLYLKGGQNSTSIEGVQSTRNDLRVRFGNKIQIEQIWSVGFDSDISIQNASENLKIIHQLHSCNLTYSNKLFSILTEYGIENYYNNMLWTHMLSSRIQWKVRNNWNVNFSYYTNYYTDNFTQHRYRIQLGSTLTI